MKQNSLFFILLFGLLLSGCNNDNNEKPLNFSESKVQMRFVIPSFERSGAAQQAAVFTGRSIHWFDETTGEIKFQDPPESSAMILAALKEADHIDFYLGEEKLFSAKVRSQIHSDYYNDVTLYVDFGQQKYYIKDGYPPLDESQKDSPAQKERDENWENIKNGYQKLIDQLRREDRIR
ncbi:MAG TPA: hypothetical protein DIT04_09540 [Dysgonomonas sp.]|nr:hypothetical protein [Dysgonomonas sp.]